MNNLKELNLIPTSVQESSEDLPGFIYPAYRAAGTEAFYPTYRAAQSETHRDKAPLKGSHQEVAYVSSAERLELLDSRVGHAG